MSDLGAGRVASGELRREVVVEGSEELLGGKELLVRPDQQREVLGHLALLDGLDAYLLERLGEGGDLGRAVELAAVLDAAGPGVDRRDRVGRSRLSLLVQP